MTMLPILTLQIRLAADAVYVRQMARDIAESLGFDHNDQTRIATAVFEIVRNAWRYAGGGEVIFGVIPGKTPMFQIRVRDNGPGFSKAEHSAPRHDPSGVGKGMIGASTIMDSFDVDTAPGAGTTVIMGKVLPLHAAAWEAATLTHIAGELAARPPQSLVEELHRQNQELLQALNQVREQQGNWERLYREMEETNRDMLAVHDALSDQNRALGHSETRSRLMVNEVTDYAIFLLDPEGNIVTWNIGAERILGFAEAHVTGGSGHVIFTAEDRKSGVPESEMRTARDTGRVEGERWYSRRDGSRFWANSVMTALCDGETLVGYVKILRDVTEQKAARDSLLSAYERERHITEVLQSPMLRKTAADALPGLSVVTLYESRMNEAEIGGDFFDAFPLPNGLILLAVGDASGKGLGAALRAMQVKELLRASFTLVGEQSPGQVVTRLNRYLCGTKPNDNGADGFVTLSLVVVDPATGEAAFLCAACEPPLVLRASGESEILSAPGMPLSVTGETAYETQPFILYPGDTLALMTDGITEVRNRSKFLDYDGMVELARTGAAAATLEEMGTVIVEGARAFGNGHFSDDVCLLLARLS
ncbi:MAG: SpoIIE family protein phosphatase [Fibrella sp.]|nr:SpoIIE family protein phosphatase [Armatimonadota bacterium]